jgi:hypothetical protein
MIVKYNDGASFLDAITTSDEGTISIDDLAEELRHDNLFCFKAIITLEARLYTREYLKELINNWKIQNTEKDNFDSIFGDQIDYAEKIRYAYARAPEEVREDALVISNIIDFINNLYSLEFKNITVIEQLIASLPASCLENKTLVSSLLRFGSIVFKYVSADLKNDKETVLAAVKHNGSELRFASDSLRNDIEVVMDAIKAQEYSLMCDYEYHYPHAFQFIGEALQNDIEIARFAVENGFPVFRLSSRELRSNAELNQIFNNLQIDRLSVEDDFENDPTLNNPIPITCKKGVEIFETIQDDSDFCIDYERFNLNRYVSLRCDKAAILNQVRTYAEIIREICPELKEDHDFMLSVVKACGMAYKFLPRKLKVQSTFAMEALKQDCNVINYLRPEILKNYEVILTVLLQNYYLMVPDNEYFVNFEPAECYVEAKLREIFNLQEQVHIENYNDVQKLLRDRGYRELTHLHYSDKPSEDSSAEIWEKTENGVRTTIAFSANKIFDKDHNLLVSKSLWDESIISCWSEAQ